MEDVVVQQPNSGNTRAEIQVNAETITLNRVSAPPPYSEYGVSVVSQTPEPQVIHQTIIIQPPLKTGPNSYNCPTCHERIITKVEYVNTKKTHLLAGFICGLTCWCMLCCLAALPYMTPFCKEVVHYCPNCKRYLGSYSRM